MGDGVSLCTIVAAKEVGRAEGTRVGVKDGTPLAVSDGLSEGAKLGPWLG